MIQVKNASLVIEQKKLLENINLSLPKGKIYGLIGHNGSGKSTLIKMLSGEIPPTTGEILINEKNISTFNHKALAKNIAYLPQKLPDATDFHVDELVMLGRFPWQNWLQKPTAADHAIVAEAMSLTSTEKFAKQAVNTLSGGERQRVWLAMCLAQQSEYLLLDEPLAALDIVYQVEVLQLIRRLVDERQLTVIIIIHDINLASQFCDELIALKNGELCCHGAVSEIMNVQQLEKIFGIRLHLMPHPEGSHRVAVV